MQLLEGAPVAHQPQRHAAGDPDSELVRVESADRDDALCLAEPIPVAQIARGRPADDRLGSVDHPEDIADAVQLLRGVVQERPELDAIEAVEIAPGITAA